MKRRLEKVSIKRSINKSAPFFFFFDKIDFSLNCKNKIQFFNLFDFPTGAEIDNLISA